MKLAEVKNSENLLPQAICDAFLKEGLKQSLKFQSSFRLG